MKSRDVVSYQVTGGSAPGMYVDFPLRGAVSFAWVGYRASHPDATTAAIVATAPIADLDVLLFDRLGLKHRTTWSEAGTTVLFEGTEGVQEVRVWAADSTHLVAVAADGEVGVVLLARGDSHPVAGQRITRVTAPDPFIDEWATVVLREPARSAGHGRTGDPPATSTSSA